MKYGQDINAFTGFDRTIYMFAVPTDFAKDEALDRSLLILHDWLDGVTIDPEKVENEKGIILEELRGFDPEAYSVTVCLWAQQTISARSPRRCSKIIIINGMCPLWQHWSL